MTQLPKENHLRLDAGCCLLVKVEFDGLHYICIYVYLFRSFSSSPYLVLCFILFSLAAFVAYIALLVSLLRFRLAGGAAASGF